jgi:hypothetical protein
MSYARCPPRMRVDSPAGPGPELPGNRGGVRIPIYPIYLYFGRREPARGPAPPAFGQGPAPGPGPRKAGRIGLAGPGASLRPRPRAAVPRRNAGGCEGRRPLGPGAGPGPGARGAGERSPPPRLRADSRPRATQPQPGQAAAPVAVLGVVHRSCPRVANDPPLAAASRGQWSLAPNSAAHQMPVFLLLY